MPLDPQINPTVVFPVLVALILLFAILWWSRADGRLQWAVQLIIGFVIIFFFLSRTAIFKSSGFSRWLAV
jgi:hypothetical protein